MDMMQWDIIYYNQAMTSKSVQYTNTHPTFNSTDVQHAICTMQMETTEIQ